MMNKSFISTFKNQKTIEFKKTLFGSLLGDNSLEMSFRELCYNVQKTKYFSFSFIYFS